MGEEKEGGFGGPAHAHSTAQRLLGLRVDAASERETEK